MTRFSTSAILLCGLLTGSLFSQSSHAGERPPNIVLIFVDDQGYYDLGCYGASEVRTPHIDELAGQGIRFTDYYAAAPICSPSRAGLLTGCYPRRVGNQTWVHRADSPSGLHPDELTIAELLKTNGYATACIGKWHLGFHEPFLPHNQGFDHYFGLLHNLDPVETVYFDDQGGVPLMRDQQVVKRPADPAELTARYTDEAIQFMKDHQDQPFFLYLPHTMLHQPLGVSPAFQGSSEWGEYGDATQELDHHVGRLMAALRDFQIDRNTVVIYASDNGRGPGRSPEQPLQGRKLSTWEAGIRVPAIAWGPGLNIQSQQQSSVVIRAMDWYPTIASLAGIPIPEDRVIDGRDLLPMLRGETSVVPPPSMNLSLNAQVPLRREWNPAGEWKPLINRYEYHEAFFYHGSQGELAAVRWRDWKLQLNPAPVLFDLGDDPGERTPVRNGEIIRKLRGMAILFQEEMRLHARPAGRISPREAAGKTEIPPEVLQRLNVQRDVEYVRYGDRALQLDLYRPRKAWGKLPAIVCIHGGGWWKGDRISHTPLAQALADRGFVTAAISYRLSGEAPFPAAIQDCRAAVRFLRIHADELGIDADKIGAVGLSAGGHLTALLATSGDVAALDSTDKTPAVSAAIQAAIAMGAQTDLMSERVATVSSAPERGEIWQKFLGGSQLERPETYRLASPLTHLDRNDPPCWLIAGERDDPSTHGERFREQMQRLGLATGLTILPDAPHAFLNRRQWFDPMLDVAEQFFRQHLTPGSSP